MPYPTADEFADVLLNQPLEQVVNQYLLRGIPYVFKKTPDSFEILRTHLHHSLNIDAANVAVVGSARIGFSLSPHRFFRRFSEQSDIDVVVIDKGLFDRAWLTIVEWNYPRRHRLPRPEWDWAKDRMNDIYWGWFVPDKIGFNGLRFPRALRPLIEISSKWFDAFRSLSKYPEFVSRDVSGRLYRTRDHAVFYHVEGLRQIRDSLLAQKMGV